MDEHENTMNETVGTNETVWSTMSANSKSPYIEILKIEDQPDGGAIITFEMDQDSLLVFAKVGILKVIKDKVEEVLDVHE